MSGLLQIKASHSVNCLIHLEMAKATQPSRPKFAITNVRVFRHDSISELCTVVVNEDGLIGGGAEGAPTIDGEGGVLLPGLIDAHVHLHHEGHLADLARHGVTTALDMATWPPDKIDRLRNKEGLTDIRSAGLPATAPGSLHSLLMPLPGEALLSGPDDAATWIDRRIAEGSDYIKLICDIPGPDQATLDALSAAAHQQKKLVVAHAAAAIPFRMALDAKVNVITHAPVDEPLNQMLAERMAGEGQISVPTLTMMDAVSQPPGFMAFVKLLWKPAALFTIIRAALSGLAPNYKNARASVIAMHQAGVPILAGTDCHEEPDLPFDVPHGESLHRELELLVDAGLSTANAIRAATCLPAQYFGLHDRGVIEEGKRADLVLLSDDPLQDIRGTRSIKRVWCRGVEYKLGADG